jgi:hypothetical protein
VAVPEERRLTILKVSAGTAPRMSPRPALRSPQDNLIKALESHVVTLKEQLAASEGRLTAAAADLEAASARADKAISAFASLADRLDQLAAERAWPWWQRLLRGA